MKKQRENLVNSWSFLQIRQSLMASKLPTIWCAVLPEEMSRPMLLSGMIQHVIATYTWRDLQQSYPFPNQTKAFQTMKAMA